MRAATALAVCCFCAMTFIMANGAQACSGCHIASASDIRPLDETWRDPYTGGFQGNHRTHMAPTGDERVCDKCHPGASKYTPGHMNFSIKVSSNINNSPVPAIYHNRTSAWRTTPTPNLGTCTNVNCHFETETPTWGIFSSATVYDSYYPRTTCTTCHGAPPPDGSHTEHAVHYPGTALCSKCHADNPTFAHATSAGKRGLSVHFTTAPNSGGAYSGNVAYPAYLPSQSTSRNGECSNVYCHSDGKGTYATATWGVPASGACTTCHANPMTNYAHAAHLTAVYGPRFGTDATGVTTCSRCHAFTGDAGATHVDGSLNIPVSACTTCHPAITDFGLWRSGRVTCDSCHAGTVSVINGRPAPDKGKAATTGHGKPASSAGSPMGVSCQSCHDPEVPHLGDAVPNPKRLRITLVGAFNSACNYCHDDQGTVPTERFRNMNTHFTSKMGPQDMDCRQCHDLHGTDNVAMIRAKVVYGDISSLISYRNVSSGMIDRGTNRGLCQICHTNTKYYRSGVPEVHHPRKNCYSCHPHKTAEGAFMPVDGNCDTCHGYPPVAADAVFGTSGPLHKTFGTDNNFVNGWYENYSGGGGAHLLHCPPTEKASDGWQSSCSVCHDQGNSHRKILPRDREWRSESFGVMGDVTVKVTPRFFVDFPVAPYQGAQLVNRPQKNGTGYCLGSCHIFEPSGLWSNPRRLYGDPP